MRVPFSLLIMRVFLIQNRANLCVDISKLAYRRVNCLYTCFLKEQEIINSKIKIK